MSDIDIKGIDKAILLAALYNRSKPQGLGYLQATPEDMSIDEARKIVQKTLSFDYLNGRVMKIDIAGDTLNPHGYDRDLGHGAAKSVVEAIRAGQSTPKNPDNLAGELENTIARAQPSRTTAQGIELGINPNLVRALEERRPLFRPRRVKPPENKK